DGEAYEHTIPGQQERKDQTTMPMARAMLKHSQLPAMFYTEVQLTAVYIYNRTVHANKTRNTSTTASQICPDSRRLERCAMPLSLQKRPKLQDTTIKCRFVGYGDTDDIQ